MIAWLFVCVLSGVARADDCTAEFSPPRFGYVRHGDADVGTVVGSGPYTTTYLERGDGGDFVVHKRYRHRARLDNDLAAFEVLAQMAVGRAGELVAIPCGLRTASAPPPHEATLIAPYAAGRVVADVLNDPDVAPEVRLIVHRTYSKCLVALGAHARGRGLEIFLASGVARGLIDGVKILVKPDNVMVDPRTLRLTIIDPY